MKKCFLAVMLILVVSVVCFAYPLEDDFGKIRKIVNEKIVKVKGKKFAALKYLINPDNELRYGRELNGGVILLGEYPDGKGDGSYAPITLFITFLPESEESAGMIALAMQNGEGGLTPFQTIMFYNGKFTLGDLFSGESIDL